MIWVDGPGKAKLPPSKSIIQGEPVQRKRVAQWTVTANGTTTFYVFGGFTYNERYLNDFWKYEYKESDEKNGTWIFLGVKTPSYGQRLVPSPSNWPTKRESATTWTDSSNNLYLFGGNGLNIEDKQGQLSDLWKFDGQNWIWINGEQGVDVRGNFVDQGKPNPQNRPGSRSLAMAWTTSKNEVFMFGGRGFLQLQDESPRVIGDFWKYDPKDNVWTWIEGKQFYEPRKSVYGKIREPNKNNLPGIRERGCSFTDKHDNLWFFGGKFEDEKQEFHNDLWRFEPLTGNWTWMGGDNQVDQSGSYGQMGLPSASNKPGSRENTFCWVDKDDMIWIFGGNGRASSQNSGKLNDLWLFKPQEYLWVWVGGSNDINNRGSFTGKFRNDAIISARKFGGYFKDFRNDLWIFGGEGLDQDNEEGNMGDLWKIKNPGVPVPPFQFTNDIIIALVFSGTFLFCLLSICVFFVTFYSLHRYELSKGYTINDGELESQKKYEEFD